MRSLREIEAAPSPKPIPPSVFEVQSIREVAEHPRKKPIPLINTLVNQGELITLTGQFDTFKSTVALELTRSVVTGEPFLGYFPMRSIGPALVFQKEIHPAFFDERLANMHLSPEYGQCMWVCYQDIRFSKLFMDQLEQAIHMSGLKLVVFDPLTNFWPVGMEENNNVAVSQVLAPIARLRSTGCTFVLVHHDTKPDTSTGIAGRARGASVILNMSDVRVFIDREPDSDTIKVSFKTRNIKRVPAFNARMDETGRMRYDS